MAKRIPDDQAFIAHGDLKIPVSIYFERRRNTRISIGADTIHLRLPKNLDKKDFEDQLTWAQKWLHKRFEKAPNLIERFKLIQFHHGDRIQIMRDTYVLHLEEDRHKSSNASLSNQDIFISLAIGLKGNDRHKVIQTLIHKLLCKRYAGFMLQRVKELNDQYFQQPFARVVLKYIHSKWGSCSHDGNIILSSKLLLCPDWARDYVIVHELAHLVELNHSPAFWNLVEEVIPNYKKAEKWLDNEGTALEIKPMHSTKLHGVISSPRAEDPVATPIPPANAPINDPTPKRSTMKSDKDFELVSDQEVPVDQAKLEPVHMDQAHDAFVLFPQQAQTESLKPIKKKRIKKKKKSTSSGDQLELF